jgi:spoIIIJ-associated protein
MEDQKVDYLERYGTDVDEAVRLALEELGLKENQVMVTVLEEPAKGFLGMGSKLAKVRVEKIEDVQEEDDISQADALAAAEKPKTKAMHDFRKKSRGGPQQSESQGSEQKQKSRQNGGAGKDGRESRNYGKQDKDRGNRGRDRGRKNEREIEIDLSGIERISEPIENLIPDPENEAAKFLADVISKMGLTVTIEGFKNDECNYIEVKGQDSRVVIGKRGQTLDALQYLTNLISNKNAETYKRVIIDVEGYRSRREKTLEQLAVKLAKKVLSTGRNARLEPMNPYERKVIHATLQQVDGITTRSEGEEPYRRVIIEKK